jgi:nucleotide-binding universal stress UspA family protein
MKFRKLLVPFDDSKPSNNAVSSAMALAALSPESHVILLHVVPELLQIPLVFEGPIHSPRTGKITTMTSYWDEIYQDLKTSGLKMVEHSKAKFVSAGISVEARTEVGNPSDVIIKHAKQDNVDLIIMGSTGLRGISKIRALGSVSRRVSEQASCPVLLVHQSPK